MTVKNLSGSGTNYPHPVCKCPTWIAHWNNNRYPNGDYHAGYCRCCNIKTNNLVGGHVIKTDSDDRQIYIVPLCDSCNKKDEFEFDVDIKDLVRANSNYCRLK